MDPPLPKCLFRLDNVAVPFPVPTSAFRLFFNDTSTLLLFHIGR